MNYEKFSRKKKQKNTNSLSKKSINKVGVLVLKILVISLILAVVVGGAIGIGMVKAIIDSAPTVDWETEVNPEKYATFIYDQQGNEVQKLHGTDANRIYVDYDQIPKYMGDAVVATEDERFWTHNGIDVQGILRAIVTNIKAGDPTKSGASTITQQIIKNNVLNSAKEFKRKIQEQYLAIKLEEVKSKEEILELYLNTAAFGRGTYGAQAAANLYFNKDVSEITIAEAAVIASITQLPTYYDPVSNPENNRAKQLIVLEKMYEQGYITENEYEDAIEEDVYSNIQIVANTIEEQSDYSYFVDEVIKRVANDLKIQKGYSENEAYNFIYSGGLSIYITQDLEMQEVVDAVYMDDSYFPPEGTYESYDIKLMYSLSIQDDEGTHHYYEETLVPSKEEALVKQEELKTEWLGSTGEVLAEKALYIPQPQSAMVIMDYRTGHVKAIAGGRGEKEGNQTFNRATQAKRQPGSCFKPLAAYLPAIDTAGYTLATIIDDVPFSVITTSGSWEPKNWYSYQTYDYRGLTTVRESIADSMNINAVKTLYNVGINTSWDYLMDLGFTTLVESETSNGQILTDKGLSLALGGITYGVTPLELTAAYGTIANGGVYTEPIFYTKVVSHEGSIIMTNEPTTRTVMKDTTAYLLTSALQSVVTEGTGKLANFDGMPVAGKTGTTSDNIDILFAGFTPYYVAGVWMGYDEPQSMDYSKSYHNVIFSTVMDQIHEELPYKDFEQPNGIVGATICTESGKLAVPGLCTDDPRGNMTRYEIFATGTVPTESCDVHVKETICTESGLFATEYCPEETLEEKVYIVRPEPLVPENWDPASTPRIKDQQYELPTSMIGEYCHIHDGTVEEVPEDENETDDTNHFFDNNFSDLWNTSGTTEETTENSNGN